jgi:hypothetical protein
MEYLFELVIPDPKHLEQSAEPLNELASVGWEVVALVPTENQSAYLALLKREVGPDTPPV